MRFLIDCQHTIRPIKEWAKRIIPQKQKKHHSISLKCLHISQTLYTETNSSAKCDQSSSTGF